MNSLLTCSQLFQKFDVNIWGNVADWIMVLVTSITALFLYLTLNSQKDVQSLQVKMTRIELDKHRILILPTFGDCGMRFDQQGSEERAGNYYGSLKIQLFGDFAYNISLIIDHQGVSIYEGNETSLKPTYSLDIPLRFHKDRDVDGINFTIRITYQDRMENLYAQRGSIYMTGYTDANPNGATFRCTFDVPTLLALGA